MADGGQKKDYITPLARELYVQKVGSNISWEKTSEYMIEWCFDQAEKFYRQAATRRHNGPMKFEEPKPVEAPPQVDNSKGMTTAGLAQTR